MRGRGVFPIFLDFKNDDGTDKKRSLSEACPPPGARILAKNPEILFKPDRRKFKKTAFVAPDPVRFTMVFGLIDFALLEYGRVMRLEGPLICFPANDDVIHLTLLLLFNR